MNTQQRIVQFIVYSNWVLLLAASTIGFSGFSAAVGLGIAAGGLIVTVNFHLLARTLKKAFSHPHHASVASVLVKYYIRFFITAIIIFMLMMTRKVDPLGLILGLSVVVASMFFATLNELRQFIIKEAG